MAVKNTRNKQDTKRASAAVSREERRRQLWSLVLFAVGVIIAVFSFIGDANAENPNGADVVKALFCGLFGISVFFTGPILIYIAVMLSADKRKGTVGAKLVQSCVIILLLCGAMHIFLGEVFEETSFFSVITESYANGKNLTGGGVLGLLFGVPLMFFGGTAAKIIIILVIFIFIMLTANISLIDFLVFVSIPFKKLWLFIKKKHAEYKEDSELLRLENEGKPTKAESRAKPAEEGDAAVIEKRLKKARNLATIEAAAKTAEKPAKPNPILQNADISDAPAETPKHTEPEKTAPTPEKNEEAVTPDSDDGPYSPELDASRNAVFEAIEALKNEEVMNISEKARHENSVLNLENAEVITDGLPAISDDNETLYVVKTELYTLPPITLLNDIVLEKSEEDIANELETNSVKLVEALKSFGVHTKIVGVCRGPSVTRYELQPAPGVKISSITKLVDDLALNLATAGVRIEAPIPNKAAVGIEVPNRKVDTVPFRAMVDSRAFSDTDSKLGTVLGRDISGEIIVADIAKMPHLLIAGTTGSGKSVCVNSIIMSILFRSTPDEVRLLMIDPKAVEFMIYNGIPHLLIPVVTDPKKAAGALGWAVTEMLNRYKLFSDNNVRDLNGYNSLCKGDPELEPMPQIVIFIDELADLMMASPGEVEGSICRLAQMARAAGMHLVIATQRPSVNVVTGVIKANIPSRIALKVASQVDSRTIIDSAGAEKLLGKGDMLFFPVGIPKPMRVQGCWVSDKEVERVVNFIKNSFVLKYDEKVIEEIERQAESVSNDKGKADTGGSLDNNDDKLDEAIEAVIEAGQASTSYLQRKLGLGYGRAAKLIDIMEQMGVVGEFKGSKPRDILMSKQDWYERKMNLK